VVLSMIKPLWAYRGFILGSVKREFQSKYRNSLLGAAWTVLQPLAMILVYTVIFSQVMRAKLPGVDSTFAYSIYLCAGILSWGLFSEITTRSQNMFLDNANLLKKLSFPRLCLPVTVVSTALLNFGIVFGLFSAFLIITGNFPGVAYLALAPLLGLLVVFAIGLGMVLGVLNVFFRDVGQFFGIFVTFWFWLTPIVYPPTILPERLQPLMALNPMASIVGALQGVLVKGEWPQWGTLVYPLALAVVLCLLGLHLFRKNAGEMVDEL
jgi:lipopolysaccharide transport system permease protein